eukprot:XP_017948671.1 PREDICTED: myb-related transcription factor, partner of profilin-like [Xenopus tropicalis]
MEEEEEGQQPPVGRRSRQPVVVVEEEEEGQQPPVGRRSRQPVVVVVEEEEEEEEEEAGPSSKGPRFSSEENSAMVEEVVRQWDSLFGAQSCQLTAARRRDLWQQVADCVSAVSGVHRDHNTVYKRFSDLKRCIKKRFVAERARAQKAGVGAPTNILFKPYERRLLDRAGVEVFGGLRGEYMDSDRTRQAQRQRPTVQERQQTRQQTPPEAEDQPQDVSGADERDPGTPGQALLGF